MWEDAHEKNFVLFYLLTTVLPHSHSCSNAHRLNMTPKHYQSTLNYKGNVLSLEECPYYKLSEQSPTKLTSVQKPWIRFQYANTYKCGERGTATFDENKEITQRDRDNFWLKAFSIVLMSSRC